MLNLLFSRSESWITKLGAVAVPKDRGNKQGPRACWLSNYQILSIVEIKQVARYIMLITKPISRVFIKRSSLKII